MKYQNGKGQIPRNKYQISNIKWQTLHSASLQNKRLKAQTCMRHKPCISCNVCQYY